MSLALAALAWWLAFVAVGVGTGLVGLHGLPRGVPRRAWPVPALAAAALLGLVSVLAAPSEWPVAVGMCAPLGLVAAVLSASAIPRRPERLWCDRRDDLCVAEPLRVEDGSGAAAVALAPTAHPRPRAVVVALHGGGNDRFFGLSYLFERLLGSGVAVVTAHLAGHGRGARDRFELRACRRRADALVVAARRRFPTARVVVLGQSLGGALALDRLARGAAAPVIAVSAPVELRLGTCLWRELAAFLRPALYRALLHASPAEALPAAGWFKRRSYPVRVAPGTRYLEVFARAVRQMELERRLRSVPRSLRALIVHGGRDGVVDVAQAHRLAESLGRAATKRIVAGATHLDPLLDARVVSSVISWIETLDAARCGARLPVRRPGSINDG